MCGTGLVKGRRSAGRFGWVSLRSPQPRDPVPLRRIAKQAVLRRHACVDQIPRRLRQRMPTLVGAVVLGFRLVLILAARPAAPELGTARRLFAFAQILEQTFVRQIELV